ncbi:MAG: hypothetical protein IKY23_10630, partial [Lachnospiraceae bacterium]|nr:hypothetical protein [Lachnospiraceae bacterium]
FIKKNFTYKISIPKCGTEIKVFYAFLRIVYNLIHFYSIFRRKKLFPFHINEERIEKKRIWFYDVYSRYEVKGNFYGK